MGLSILWAISPVFVGPNPSQLALLLVLLNFSNLEEVHTLFYLPFLFYFLLAEMIFGLHVFFFLKRIFSLMQYLTTNFSDFQLATFGTFIIHESVFFLSGIPSIFLERSGLFSKYKIQVCLTALLILHFQLLMWFSGLLFFCMRKYLITYRNLSFCT